ncbi:uncharacterized protein TNCV_12431 [Trichonephila clavipes]|nr:uncharacterized protein TNCV_12431 [Trichonephila clavipes]
MPPDFDCVRSRSTNSSWQGARCTPVVGRSLEHHIGDSTILAQFHLNLVREHPDGWGQGPPTSSLPLTSREDLRLDGYLEYPHDAKALYFCKHPCFLRDSNPGPTAQQSKLLSTIPDGRHYYILITS